MKAAIYTRISADVAGDEHGVKQQLAECEAKARELGWQVVEYFSDNDISAFGGKARPGYAQLTDAITKGRLDAVIAWHTDRLHRSLVEFQQFADLCSAKQVAVHTCKGGSLDLKSASGQLVGNLHAIFAQFEVAHMIERQKSSHVRRATEGKYRGGRRPFGYEADGVTPRADEFAALGDAAKRILRGDSIMSVVRAWNDAGLKTSTGKRWESTTTRRVLLRARSAGLVEHNGNIVGIAQWPAAIPEDEWNALKGIFGDPTRKSAGHTTERRWMGSGIYRCGVCAENGVDKRLSVNSTMRGVRQYRCYERAGATHLTRALEPLDQYITDLVLRRLSRDDAKITLVDSRPEVDVVALQAQLDGIEAEMNTYALQLAQGKMRGKQFEIVNTEKMRQYDEAERLLSSARIHSPLSDMILAGDKLSDYWAGLSPTLQGKIIDELMVVTVKRIERGDRNKPFEVNRKEYIGIEWRRDQ